MQHDGPIDSPEKFASVFKVSRETLERLACYEQLLRQWQKGTNLVAPATLDHVWHRHFADSAQLLKVAGDWKTWIDLGSGAGFPGLVIAICVANREDVRVHLVESNSRKCAFLQEVVRETASPVEIHATRIESMGRASTVPPADVISARALAPLSELLALSAPFMRDGTRGLFLKGRQAGEEISSAREKWQFESRLHPSVTESGSAIVEVRDLRQGGNHVVEAADE